MKTHDMNDLEKTLQMIKKYLPTAGTELGAYTFLTADKLWTGEINGIPFVAVAEDRWPFHKGGYFLAVTTDGAVYIANLDNGNFTNYCAAGFPQFIEIMKLYQAALETTPTPDVNDEEGYRYCKEAEQTLRQQIMKIDPTAIEDTEGFWSTLIEELGYGM